MRLSHDILKPNSTNLLVGCNRLVHDLWTTNGGCMLAIQVNIKCLKRSTLLNDQETAIFRES